MRNDRNYDWEKLRRQLSGQLVMKNEAGYADLATQDGNPNPLYTNTPEGIAVRSNPDDVSVSVRWATEQGVPLSPVGRQHNYAGCSDIQGGLSIYLAKMNKVDPYDHEHDTVRVRAGVNIQHVYDALRASNPSTSRSSHASSAARGSRARRCRKLSRSIRIGWSQEGRGNSV